MEPVSRPTKDKVMTGNTQHGFTKGKQCLNKLSASSDETTGSLDEGRAVDILE